jgi:hypothetical protein
MPAECAGDVGEVVEEIAGDVKVVPRGASRVTGTIHASGMWRMVDPRKLVVASSSSPRRIGFPVLC